MTGKQTDYHRFIFENPWCPLFGDIPSADLDENSAADQCCTVISDARMFLHSGGFYLMPVNSLEEMYNLEDSFNSMHSIQFPCDGCENSRRDSRLCEKGLSCKKLMAYKTVLEERDLEYDSISFPCDNCKISRRFYQKKCVNGLNCEDMVFYETALAKWESESNSIQFPCDGCKRSRWVYLSCEKSLSCEKMVAYETALTDEKRKDQYPPVDKFPEPYRTNILCARAIFHEFEYIEKQTLIWPDQPPYNIEFGTPWNKTTVSNENILRRFIEQIRDSGHQDNDEWIFIDEHNIPDHIILAIAAISKAWYALRDILYFTSPEEDKFDYQNMHTAQALLAKANELMEKSKIIDFSKKRHEQHKKNRTVYSRSDKQLWTKLAEEILGIEDPKFDANREADKLINMLIEHGHTHLKTITVEKSRSHVKEKIANTLRLSFPRNNKAWKSNSVITIIADMLIEFELGTPIYQTDDEGKQVTNDNGEPIIKRRKLPNSTVRDHLKQTINFSS